MVMKLCVPAARLCAVIMSFVSPGLEGKTEGWLALF
jgi:hypothetical protein